MMEAGSVLGGFLHALIYEESDEAKEEKDHGDAEFMAVLVYFVHKLVLRHYALQAVADGGKDDVPEAGTDGGVENEVGKAHLGQACGDGDEMTDTRDEATDEGSISPSSAPSAR